MQRWAGWAMYPTDPARWNWTKSDKNLFNFSYEMKLNANHSLYLRKTLLTKSAVAGFQLWVSSLAAFCLANRRFSPLRDKEVEVRWLVLVLGCQLITCSDARQGSRSSPSTVSYVLHTQRCCFRYSVCKDLNGVVRLSGTGWSKFVGKFFIFMTRQPGAYTLTVILKNYASLARARQQSEALIYIEGFRPEWCISTIYHAWDTPFWSGTLDIYWTAAAHVNTERKTSTRSTQAIKTLNLA